MSELTALRNQVRKLKESLERHKRHIAVQDSRNESLLRTVRELALVKEPLYDVDMEEEEEVAEDADVEGDEENQEDNENSDEEDDEGLELFLPIWDEHDHVYRCHNCVYEVLDGFCQRCGTEYDVPEEFVDSDQEAAFYFDNGATISSASSHDRRTSPRGDTPLPEYRPVQTEIPYAYRFNRHDEYIQLRTRGASVQMCSKFSLSFKPDEGIIAILTSEIKETFGGPEMRQQDTWELYLGRRVSLDEDDSDGSEFIIGLLEDALLFERPLYVKSHPCDQWQTTRPSGRPYVWATMPTKSHVCYEKLDEDDPSGSDEYLSDDSELYYPGNDASPEQVEAWYNAPANRWTAEDRALVTPFIESGPTLHQDEYEMTDVEDLETDDDGDPDVADPGYAANPRHGHTNWSDGEDDGQYESEASAADNSDEEHDDFDSDFDSDDQLSGDEQALGTQTQ
ncbi:hypothetical protein VKT23_015489 [Stygiomarasmius scandens]|uniref:DUF8191 domain-containing protein n=1 Tax=Marasmiellus scandens TaxID=2682957 RepID=A0ABR1IY12_9AGAR